MKLSENAVPLILTPPPSLLSVREALVANLRPLFRPPRMSSSRQLWRRAIYPFVLKTTSRTLPIYRRSSCMVLCGRPFAMEQCRKKCCRGGFQGQRVHQTEAIRNLIFQGIPSGYFITGPGGFPITIVWVFSSPVKSRGA